MSRAAHKILKADPVMAALIEVAQPYERDQRPERTPFEVLSRAIAHQQLNGVVAGRILARLCALYQETFPSPQQLLQTEDAQLRSVGFSFSKIAALKDLASKTVEGVVPTIDEMQQLTDDEIVERVTQVRGIGRWTVEMMLMFHLHRPDVLPVDDFGVRNGFRLAYRLAGMPTTRALALFGERWRPHRTLAAWYLWRACDLHKAQKLPSHRRRIRVELQAARVKKKARKKIARKRAANASAKSTKKASRKSGKARARE